MNVADQGLHSDPKRRYHTVPRSLIFVTGTNPASGDPEVLLLKGAPHKRLWANKYNGIGGHIEGDEDVLSGAERELREETGLSASSLTLRGVINIHTGPSEKEGPSGVMVFVFRAWADQRHVRPGPEGTLAWIPVSDLASYPLVDDLYELIPRVLADGPIFYGHYTPGADGTMRYHFRLPSG